MCLTPRAILPQQSRVSTLGTANGQMASGGQKPRGERVEPLTRVVPGTFAAGAAAPKAHTLHAAGTHPPCPRGARSTPREAQPASHLVPVTDLGQPCQLTACCSPALAALPLTHGEPELHEGTRLVPGNARAELMGCQFSAGATADCGLSLPACIPQQVPNSLTANKFCSSPTPITLLALSFLASAFNFSSCPTELWPAKPRYLGTQRPPWVCLAAPVPALFAPRHFK